MSAFIPCSDLDFEAVSDDVERHYHSGRDLATGWNLGYALLGWEMVDVNAVGIGIIRYCDENWVSGGLRNGRLRHSVAAHGEGAEIEGVDRQTVGYPRMPILDLWVIDWQDGVELRFSSFSDVPDNQLIISSVAEESSACHRQQLLRDETYVNNRSTPQLLKPSIALECALHTATGRLKDRFHEMTHPSASPVRSRRFPGEKCTTWTVEAWPLRMKAG